MTIGKRRRRDRYLVYSLAMSARAGGGYLHRFERDQFAGSAGWGVRHGAKEFADLHEAIAVAMLVGEHESVEGAVVLDAETQRRVDCDPWANRSTRRSRTRTS